MTRPKYFTILFSMVIVLLVLVTGCTSDLEDNISETAPYDGSAMESADILITEVCYYPEGNNPNEEYIELFNSSVQKVDMDGWVLRNYNGDSEPYKFSGEATIEAGETLVVTKKDSSLADSQLNKVTDFNIDLSKYGDLLVLSDADGDDHDHVAWGKYLQAWDLYAKAGNVISRKYGNIDSANSAGEWESNVEKTPGEIKMADDPDLGKVVISEVGIDRGDNDSSSDSKFYEIYNKSGEAVDISNWEIVRSQYTDDVDSYKISSGTVLDPGETFVLARRSNYGGADFQDAPSPDAVDGGMWMTSNGAIIMLVNELGMLSDRVAYLKLGWSDFGIDFDDDISESMERYPANKDTDEEDDFRRQTNPTPGRVTDLDNIIISEVGVDRGANSSSNDCKFYEIYNKSDYAVDISGWSIVRLQDNQNDVDEFVISDDTIIESKDTFVLARRENYGGNEFQDAPPPDAIDGGMWMSSNGAVIRIKNQAGDIADEAAYIELGWPDFGINFSDDIPESIERKSLEYDSDNPSDFKLQQDPNPGIVN